MAKRDLVLSRGEAAVLDRLRDEAVELARLARHVAAVKARRALLIVKARRAGIPARTIAASAGVSNVAVLLIANAWTKRAGSPGAPA